jgi:acyl-CoA hydrolase
MQTHKVSETLNIQTELIMPAHTNPIGNLMGGHLLSWMDVCAGISAIKHIGGISVTASLDNVSFNLPIKMGGHSGTEVIRHPLLQHFHGGNL